MATSSKGGHGHRRAAPAAKPVPATPSTPGARTFWDDGEWTRLAAIDEAALPAGDAAARAELAARIGAAHLQLGDFAAARRFGRLAREAGASRAALARAWLQAPAYTLALGAWAAGEEPRLLRERMRQLAGEADADRLVERVREEGESRLAPVAPARWAAPRWIEGLADECLAAEDVHDAADRLLETVLLEPEARFEFNLAMSERFKARGDPATAAHFLGMNQALLGPGLRPALVAELVRRYGALGHVDAALELALGQWLEGGRAPALEPALARQLLAQHQRLSEPARARAQHGHHVLLGYLEAHAPELEARAKSRPRGLTVIEIGSTREAIPGQGSTRQIAAFCLAHGLKFVTVDMDPHNSRMARETFAAMGAPFEAVTMKGEDYLRAHEEPLDVVFLDAYDFDHGRHSALRQSRYEKYIGSPIDDRQCHLMHLDCAQSIVAKLDADGVVCIDDTWLEDGRWVAKGALAMPYLLDNGIVLLEARNHAALLGRAVPEPAQAPTETPA